jgi:ATP-dependent RNA helicase RhlE
MLFNELGLSADLLRAVEEQGYEKPTPIQRQAIPHILEGHDILAGAQTGTGKTAGFTLPMLQILGDPPTGPRRVRALILTPTRELAAQVRNPRSLARSCPAGKHRSLVRRDVCSR